MVRVVKRKFCIFSLISVINSRVYRVEDVEGQLVENPYYISEE